VLIEGGDFSPGETPDLTDRQKQILRLVAQGKSNKEIARALDILEGTVKAHLRFLMKHLNAKNRTQLAVMASKLR
jgi:DNA-binding NarL/FixJ family response regulator